MTAITQRRALAQSRGLFQATINGAAPITSAGRFSIGEYDQHNRKHAHDDYERNIHLAMISPWGLFD